MEERQRPYFFEALHREFVRRKKRNYRYSLRAYASSLKLDPSTLSRVFSGKQDLSDRVGCDVARRLGLSADEQRVFLASLVEHNRDRVARRLGARISAPGLRQHPREIPDEVYERLGDLERMSVLEMTQIRGFRPDPAWIAERLGIDAARVEQAIRDLLEAGLLLRGEDGSLAKASRHMTAVNTRRTSEARRRQQRQILERSLEALDKVPFARRCHRSMVMAVDPARLPEAWERIQKFIEDLSDLMESGERTELYQLGVQIFPLTRPAGEPAAPPEESP